MGTKTVLCLLLSVGIAFAQSPTPVGKSSNGKNYRAADGSLLSNNTSDEALQQALSDNYTNDPEFSGIRVSVRHHRVTLEGSVINKDARRRAERMAEDTAGVRSVRSRLKLADSRDVRGLSVAESH